MIAHRSPSRMARLDVLDTGDPAASIRAAFSWSSQQLGEAIGAGAGIDVAAESEAVDDGARRRAV